MSVETLVLCSDSGMNDVWRELLVADERPVLDMEGRQYLSVRRNHLSCELAVRILEFLE